jgi:hypothetical protein
LFQSIPAKLHICAILGDQLCCCLSARGGQKARRRTIRL